LRCAQDARSGNTRLASDLAGRLLAHVFRKFEEASPDHPEALTAMKWIGELYAIDDRAEGDLAKKAELRKSESASIIATMKSWLWSQAILKTLSIGQAAANAARAPSARGVGRQEGIGRDEGNLRPLLLAMRGEAVAKHGRIGWRTKRMIDLPHEGDLSERLVQ
jgi:hypothetical protein